MYHISLMLLKTRSSDIRERGVLPLLAFTLDICAMCTALGRSLRISGNLCRASRTPLALHTQDMLSDASISVGKRGRADLLLH